MRNSGNHENMLTLSNNELGETVRSDEFLSNKLYTNTQAQAINQAGSLTSSYENLPNQDGGYVAIHHANLIKTTNSFYQRSDLDNQTNQI